MIITHDHLTFEEAEVRRGHRFTQRPWSAEPACLEEASDPWVQGDPWVGNGKHTGIVA